jgi:hypothetical protein
MFSCVSNTMKHTVVKTTVPAPVVVVKVARPSFQEFMLAPPPNWICCRYPLACGSCLFLTGAGFAVLFIYAFGGFLPR